MFRARCDQLGRDVLIWPSDVLSADNLDIGILLRYRCVCGDVAELLTGSGASLHLSLHAGGLPEARLGIV